MPLPVYGQRKTIRGKIRIAKKILKELEEEQVKYKKRKLRQARPYQFKKGDVLLVEGRQRHYKLVQRTTYKGEKIIMGQRQGFLNRRCYLTVLSKKYLNQRWPRVSAGYFVHVKAANGKKYWLRFMADTYYWVRDDK